MLGALPSSWFPNAICIKNKTELDVKSALEVGNHKEFGIHIAACDRMKRSTCKTREETATLLNRSTLKFYAMRNVVVDNQF